MNDEKEKEQKAASESESKSCCYTVVDACGCPVGWYCCDGPDMTQCQFESCC